MTFIVIVVVLFILVWLVKQKKSPQQINDEQRRMVFDIEKPKREFMIRECLDTIEKTKNIDTGMGRFESIKDNLNYIIQLAPSSAKVLITLNGIEFKSRDDIAKIDRLKTDWMRAFLNNKIDGELKKSDMLSDPKLQRSQLKKALSATLKSFDYFPDDNAFKGTVMKIESRLNSIDSSSGKVRLK